RRCQCDEQNEIPLPMHANPLSMVVRERPQEPARGRGPTNACPRWSLPLFQCDRTSARSGGELRLKATPLSLAYGRGGDFSGSATQSGPRPATTRARRRCRGYVRPLPVADLLIPPPKKASA